MTTLQAYLRLARISNLPTVWSNVLAASALAGAPTRQDPLLIILAGSLLYTSGMFLNDAFDQRIDSVERPSRPIPSGAIPAMAAWISGLGMMITGVVLFASFGYPAAIGSLTLAAAIIIYDAWHKQNPIAPFIMGLCRALLYLCAGAATGAMLSAPLIVASLALLAYVAGLTFAAKEEAFDRVQSWWPLALLGTPLVVGLINGGADPLVILLVAATAVAIIVALGWLKRRSAGDVGRAVSLLIAAIALTDAVAAATAGHKDVALICCGMFLLTLVLQRIVPGT